MDTGPAQRQLCGSGGHLPHRHRILQQEVRWRPPKWGSRVLAPPGTRRRRHTHSGEPPERAGRPRRELRSVQTAQSAGCHPLAATATTGGPITTTTRARSVVGVTGWVISARRTSPNVGARTLGRWRSVPAGCHPLGGHRDDGRPEHDHYARAERAGGDWVGHITHSRPSARRRRTCSIRSGSVVPCAAPDFHVF